MSSQSSDKLTYQLDALSGLSQMGVANLFYSFIQARPGLEKNAYAPTERARLMRDRHTVARALQPALKALVAFREAPYDPIKLAYDLNTGAAGRLAIIRKINESQLVYTLELTPVDHYYLEYRQAARDVLENYVRKARNPNVFICPACGYIYHWQRDRETSPLHATACKGWRMPA